MYKFVFSIFALSFGALNLEARVFTGSKEIWEFISTPQNYLNPECVMDFINDQEHKTNNSVAYIERIDEAYEEFGQVRVTLTYKAYADSQKFKSTLICQQPHSRASSTAKSEEKNAHSCDLTDKFKKIIGSETYVSETDAEWEKVCVALDPKIAITSEVLKKVLKLPELHKVRIRSAKSLKSFWSYYTDPTAGHQPSTINHYQALKNEMEKQLPEIYYVHTGDPGSAEKRIYLIGRAKDGPLVGLSTISVET